MRSRISALLLPLVLAACGSPAPTSTTVGTLPPHSTMTVRAATARIAVYAPKAGDPRDQYTVLTFGPPPAPSATAQPARMIGSSLQIPIASSATSAIVRVPDGVDLDVSTGKGDVEVTDISGRAMLHTDAGSIEAFVPAYAQASTGVGNITVSMGATQWPGTLHFSSGQGDIALSVPATAHFAVHLHTGDGTIFTEWGLTGTSRGTEETMDGRIGGGHAGSIDIEVARGNIRLLQLRPQV